MTITAEQLNATIIEMKGVKDSLSLVQTKLNEMEAKNLNGLAGGSVPNSQLSRGFDSVESKAMLSFGAKNIKELVEVNTESPRFAGVKPELKQMVRTLKTNIDSARLLAQITKGQPRDFVSSEGEQMARVDLGVTAFGREVLAQIKAFTSTGAGSGDEFVPTLLSSSWQEELMLDHQVEGQFQQIQMPSNPYELGTVSGGTLARKIGENTAITDTNFTTGKLTFTAIKIGEYHIIGEELNEDSAIAIIPLIRQNLLWAHMKAVENAIINGDDDGTHIDTDTQAAGADVSGKFWKGLRRQAIANSANGGTFDYGNANLTDALLRQHRAKGGKAFTDPSNLLWLCDPSVYTQFLALPSTLTLDKYGPYATVFKGSMTQYGGSPIFVSQHMRNDLNATGVNDGVTTNRAGLILVNKARWYVATRRAIKIMAMQDLPNQDRWLMAAYQRKAFLGAVQSASEVSVSYGYNISA